MRNTLRAALKKWLHSRPVWLSLLFSLGCGLLGGYLCMTLLPVLSADGPEPDPDLPFFQTRPFHIAFAVQLLCIIAVTAMRAGLERAEGAVRNYLIIGCRRTVFYAAQIITAVLYAAVCAALMLVPFAVICQPALHYLPGYGRVIVLFGLILVTAGAVTAALAVNTERPVITLLAVLACGTVLTASAFSMHRSLAVSDPYTLSYAEDGSGRLRAVIGRHPYYIESPQREWLLCLHALDPAGQYFICIDMLESAEVYMRRAGSAVPEQRADGSAACPICFAAICVLLGCAVFQKRDIK